jgi:hypothetical protein
MENKTVDQYIAEIQTVGEMFNLAKQLKKMDRLSMNMVDTIMMNARVSLMENNREEYDRWIRTVKMETRLDETYGCMKTEIMTNHGGTIKISDWRQVENSGGSIATIHISNGWGMGGSKYLNNIKDIDKEIESAKRITWINETERTFLINTLEELKK